MMGGIRPLAVIALVLVLSLGAYGQATVNVSPGDDIDAALQEAGPDGTVVFAPGWYDVGPTDLGQDTAILVTADLEGITVRGAGPGWDPSTATIIDGDAWFLETGIEIRASGVTVEGFTIVNFWDEAFKIQSDNTVFNVDIRQCWSLGCDTGMDTGGSGGGWWDEADPENYADLIRISNCIFARGGDDGTDIEDNHMQIYINCDFYDWDSDIMENEDNTIVLVRNCIIHAGGHSDDFDSGSGLIISSNSVFYDPPGPGGIEFVGVIDDTDSIDIDDTDPLYVNVGPHVALEDLDFHLNVGSEAVTVGKDLQGNPTYAGALGPAQ